MMGKLYLFAFVCFAFSQVRGEDLEEAKKQALMKLKGISMGVEKEIQHVCKEVNIKMEVVQNKTSSILKGEMEMERHIKTSWNRTAEEMEKKAKETNKPPATFECIKKAHAHAVSRLEALRPKFQAEIKDMEKNTLAFIRDRAEALKAVKASLGAKYEKAVAQVRGCKDAAELGKVMEELRKDYALTVVGAKKEMSTVGQKVGRFSSDVSASLSRVAEQADKIAEEGHRAMRNCVF